MSQQLSAAVVASYPKTNVVADGRLTTTDVHGIRLDHNTEARVTGRSVTRH